MGILFSLNSFSKINKIEENDPGENRVEDPGQEPVAFYLGPVYMGEGANLGIGVTLLY